MMAENSAEFQGLLASVAGMEHDSVIRWGDEGFSMFFIVPDGIERTESVYFFAEQHDARVEQLFSCKGLLMRTRNPDAVKLAKQRLLARNANEEWGSSGYQVFVVCACAGKDNIYHFAKITKTIVVETNERFILLVKDYVSAKLVKKWFGNEKCLNKSCPGFINIKCTR